MAVSGISGLDITGSLGNGNIAVENARSQNDIKKFSNLLEEMNKKIEQKNLESVSSSNISKNHKLNGDYTQGFYGSFTNEADKNAKPKGFASSSRTLNGKTPTIDKTSDLYVQSMEMENYMVKMMLSSMRETVHHTNLSGNENDFARKMYEDMMYDNMSEAITKNASLGLADAIYIELSGQR